MANSLFSLVKEATQNLNGRTPIGYTVKDYQGVLAKLNQDLRTIHVGDSSGGDVFGVVRTTSFTQVESLSFDDNGISNDTSIPIWKMRLNFSGSIPLEHNGQYYLVHFGNDSNLNSGRNPFCNSAELCPLELDSTNVPDVEKFKIGASLDLMGFALEYFKRFYAKPDNQITNEHVTALIENKLLRAQVIFPKKNKYEIAGIIGQTPFSENACCYLTTPLIGANGWNDCGIILKVQEKCGQAYQVVPTGSEYKFPCLGNQYNVGDNSMVGMTKEDYQNWARTAGEEKTLELIKPELEVCYVKLFVPQDKEKEAREHLPIDINTDIFKTYPGVVKEVAVNNTLFSGKSATIMEGVCRKWENVLVSQPNGGFWYNQSLKPDTLYRNKGGQYYAGGNVVTALFGHPDGTGNFDCSSLPFLFLYDANIIRDDKQSMPTFWTGNLKTAASTINQYIKDDYKMITLDFTSANEVRTGDILWVESADGTGDHHAAMAYWKDGKLHTLEIGDKDNRRKRPVCMYSARTANGHYKHILRLIDNPDKQNG